jgi:hypothetical protein
LPLMLCFGCCCTHVLLKKFVFGVSWLEADHSQAGHTSSSNKDCCVTSNLETPPHVSFGSYQFLELDMG